MGCNQVVPADLADGVDRRIPTAFAPAWNWVGNSQVGIGLSLRGPPSSGPVIERLGWATSGSEGKALC